MKLFILLSRIPYPLEKGDKLRAYHQIKELSKKHQIHLCCLTDVEPHSQAEAELKKISEKLLFIKLKKTIIYSRLFYALFSRKPYQVHYFLQRRAKRIIHKEINAFKPDHIYCQLIRTTEYIKKFFEIPKTLDYMDALSKGMERRIEKASFLKKFFFVVEHQRLLEYENLIFEYFDAHTIISEQDRDLIFHPKQKEISVITNGIDTQFFSSSSKTPEYDLVFHGNMSYPPNIDAALFLVNEILPLVKIKKPEIKVLISGINPTRAIKELESKHVTVSGWVNDVRESYGVGKIFIAPMRIGTGLQNKLLEAMAMSIPSITTDLANNALKATKNENILIANSAQENAKEIIRLLEDVKLSQKLAKNGRKYVQSTYSWKSSCDKLNGLMHKA